MYGHSLHLSLSLSLSIFWSPKYYNTLNKRERGKCEGMSGCVCECFVLAGIGLKKKYCCCCLVHSLCP
jgi:hypothetical protein